ncbi:hypothetical protein AcW1_002868 [Taiwanofungus camphoratus]|nr:hypothetical protein AcW1_002868 [Antrodia cinnamomea]
MLKVTKFLGHHLAIQQIQIKVYLSYSWHFCWMRYPRHLRCSPKNSIYLPRRAEIPAPTSQAALRSRSMDLHRAPTQRVSQSHAIDENVQHVEATRTGYWSSEVT